MANWSIRRKQTSFVSSSVKSAASRRISGVRINDSTVIGHKCRVHPFQTQELAPSEMPGTGVGAPVIHLLHDESRVAAVARTQQLGRGTPAGVAKAHRAVHDPLRR